MMGHTSAAYKFIGLHSSKRTGTCIYKNLHGRVKEMGSMVLNRIDLSL